MDANNELLQAISTMIDSKLLEALEPIKKSQLNVELVELRRIAAALDGFSNAKEKNEEQDERITYLEKKADIHDARLFVLEQSAK